MSKFVELPTEVRRALIEQYGGEMLYVPKRDPAVIESRNTQIKRLSESGAPVSEIARQVGLSPSQVYRID